MVSVQKTLGNWTYYSVVGNGEWHGKFSFHVKNWRLFWHDNIGFWNRFFAVSMYLSAKVTGPSVIISTLKVFPDVGLAGIIANHVVIKKLGIPLYVLNEHYVLHPEGEKVYVHARERLGPVSFLFKRSKWHPAIITNNGLKANYLDMPILGTIWTGDYLVNGDQNAIDSTLTCRWAEATELINKVANGPPISQQQFFAYPKSIKEVLSYLERYRDWFDLKKDSRATFTHTYLRINELFDRTIPTAGFHDQGWVTDLVVAFANEYLKAIHDFDSGSISGAWLHVFDTIVKKRTSVLEELILSMAAHIIQDLPFALHKTGWQQGPEDERIADFHLVNDILCDEIGKIQDEIIDRYNGFLRRLDQFSNDDDEILTNYGIRVTRGMAWYNAIRLKTDPAGVAESLTRSVQAVIKQTTSPPFSLSFLFRFVRLISQVTRRWPSRK